MWMLANKGSSGSITLSSLSRVEESSPEKSIGSIAYEQSDWHVVDSNGPSQEAVLGILPDQVEKPNNKVIGKVTKLSTGNNGLDWAMLTLEESRFADFLEQPDVNRIPETYLHDGEPLQVSRIAKPPLEEQNVLVITASKGVLPGILARSPSFYRASKNQKFVKVLSVRLNQNLSKP
jgi:hypothetical protein